MKIDTSDPSSYISLFNEDLYRVQYEIEQVLQNIYKEEYRRGLLKKYMIEYTYRDLQSDSIYKTFGWSCDKSEQGQK